MCKCRHCGSPVASLVHAALHSDCRPQHILDVSLWPQLFSLDARFSHLQNGNIICPVLEAVRISSVIHRVHLRAVLDQNGSREIAMHNNLTEWPSSDGSPGLVVCYFWTIGLPPCGRLFIILAYLLLS